MIKICNKGNRFIIVLLAVLFILSGCSKDWLGGEPKGRLTEEDIPPGDLRGLVFAAYASLRSEGTSGLPYAAVHNIRSDDADVGGSSGDEAAGGPIFDNFVYSKVYWLSNNYWSDHYKVIAAANMVISTADSLGTASDEALSLVAEAKFIRAFAYFNMVRAFGEVPKIDFRIYTQDQANVPKSSIAEIYALIDADLQAAITYLPVRWDIAQYTGRLTKGAAYALQAKTFLARNQWGQALAAAQAVINSGEYDLSMPYDQIFKEEGENGPESIFEIQATYTQSITNLGITWASRQGIRGAGDLDLGWGWNIPNERLVNAFEPNDPRKDATILFAGSTTNYGEVLPSTLPRPYFNKKVYTNPRVRTQTGSRMGEWFNLRILRYSDVVLMAAEAANETGNQELALEYLERVRARARGSNSGILPRVTTTDQVEIRNAIRHERQVELGMENERFFDLVRWGIDVETMHAAGKTNYQIRNRFLPIPQAEIDRSGGVLIQNPNY